jgi:hypothetical protein
MAGGGDTRETAAHDALGADEVGAITGWVESGGALLLAFDHYPNDAAIATLASALGISVARGMTTDDTASRVPWNCFLVCRGWIGFDREPGRLRPHAVLDGRSAAERISRVVTFGGSSLTTGDSSSEFLALSPAAVNVANGPDDETGGPVGRAQGAAIRVGSGRVVALADSNMIGTQLLPLGARDVPMGLAVADNRQLLLNLLHWLSRLIGA